MHDLYKKHKMNTHTQIQIRKALESDINSMISHRIEYLIEMQGERSEDFINNLRRELVTFFSEGMKDGTVVALVAENQLIPVSYGVLVLHKVPGDFNKSTYLEADILNMYTIPSERKKGISAMILEQLINIAKSLGVSKIALHTTQAGEKLYRNAGFNDPMYPYLEKNI